MQQLRTSLRELERGLRRTVELIFDEPARLDEELRYLAPRSNRRD